METRLYNIFKSKNATKLARPIPKTSYKVLLETRLSVTLRQPVHFLGTVEFLATFNLQINSFGNILRKVAKLYFLENLHKIHFPATLQVEITAL